MKTIGITGSSGSGKTIVAKKIAEKLNAKMINADEIVRILSKKGQEYYNAIVDAFGTQILDEAKQINRAKLANRIYNNNEEREKLNNITNNYVVNEIKKQVKNMEDEEIVIIDVPLLFESKLNEICNITIGIIADEKLKIERICKRDQIQRDIAISRLKIQPQDQFYIKNADYIIENNNEIDEKICEIITKIQKRRKNV